MRLAMSRIECIRNSESLQFQVDLNENGKTLFIVNWQMKLMKGSSFIHRLDIYHKQN